MIQFGVFPCTPNGYLASPLQVIPVAFDRPRLSLWISDLHIFRLRPSIQYNRLHTSIDKSSSGRAFDALDLFALFQEFVDLDYLVK